MPRRRLLGGGGLRGRLADSAGEGGANDAADGDDQDGAAGESGGGQEASPPSDQTPAPASADESMDELTKLKGLLDEGVLTQDEFDTQKQKILQNM
jgi:hypothetical protein